MNESKSFNNHPAHKALSHALMESLLADKEGMDQGVVNLLKRKKRQHDDQDEDPSAGPNQGKKTKRSRTKEPESSKKSSTSKDTSKECFKALTDRLDWENPEGDRCPFDLSKPLPLKGVGFGIKHWGPKRQQFYRAQLNRFSKHDVFSHQKILSVVSVKVEKLHGYSYLEEIMVRRADQQLYKFKEGDFVNLHLNDIKDMLLLVIQHKLFHLDGEVIVDLAVALRMFTRSLKIKKRVKDV
uniref:Uncharacterized protein n=1 Tax=Tanacetum cinerariifolium TaxID=118510 RepID=A0A699I0X9_TANCI|nr:hypothetical protein [Tanacetum cinerariifolium]